MNKKYFFDSKVFGIISILYGIIGLLILAHHVGSYEAILRPKMEYLIENKVITNNINGGTFLYFFTNQSNIFADVFLVLFGMGLFGNKKLYGLTHHDTLRGAITLYIVITGIIYCCVLLPFSTGGYPWERGIWFSNIVNYWSHMITPAVFALFWFVPLENKPIKTVKTAAYYLIYPILYFVFSVIRGNIVDFYPYPFLNGKQLFYILFSGKEYSILTGNILLIVVVILFSGIFFGIGCLINLIHNKSIKFSNKSKDIINEEKTSQN